MKSILFFLLCYSLSDGYAQEQPKAAFIGKWFVCNELVDPLGLDIVYLHKAHDCPDINPSGNYWEFRPNGTFAYTETLPPNPRDGVSDGVMVVYDGPKGWEYTPTENTLKLNSRTFKVDVVNETNMILHVIE